MPEAGEDGAAVDADRFKRIYDYLRAIADELDKIKKNHIMILTGPDLNTLVDIDNDERVLDRDVHILQRRLDAHHN